MKKKVIKSHFCDLLTSLKPLPYALMYNLWSSRVNRFKGKFLKPYLNKILCTYYFTNSTLHDELFTIKAVQTVNYFIKWCWLVFYFRYILKSIYSWDLRLPAKFSSWLRFNYRLFICKIQDVKQNHNFNEKKSFWLRFNSMVHSYIQWCKILDVLNADFRGVQKIAFDWDPTVLWCKKIRFEMKKKETIELFEMLTLSEKKKWIRNPVISFMVQRY